MNSYGYLSAERPPYYNLSCLANCATVTKEYDEAINQWRNQANETKVSLSLVAMTVFGVSSLCLLINEASPCYFLVASHQMQILVDC